LARKAATSNGRLRGTAAMAALRAVLMEELVPVICKASFQKASSS
jgi:hypothetical protein